MGAIPFEGRVALERAWVVPVVVLAAAAIGASAVVAPPLALALALGLGFVAAALWRLAAGLALFTLVSFFEVMPGVGDSGALKAAGGVLVLAWLGEVLRRDRSVLLLPRDHPAIAYAAVALVVWALASSVWAQDSGRAISGALRLAQGVVLVFIVYTAVRRRHDLRLVLGAFILGAASTALVGLAGGTPADEFDPYADVGRFAGGIGDPNELAAIAVPALVFSAFGLSAFRAPLARWALVVGLMLCSLAVFMTQSRGGLVALASVFLLAPFVAGPVRSRAIAFTLVVGALGIGYYTLVAPPQALSRISDFSDGGGTGRGDLWPIAVRMIGDNSTVGVGFGNFKLEETRYALQTIDLRRPDLVVDDPKVAHNTYLHVTAELGFVGLLLFVTMVGGALLAAWRGVKAAAARDMALEVQLRGLVLGVLGMLVAFTFISGQFEKHFWLLLGLLPAAAAVVRRDAGAPEAPEYDLDVREQLVEQLERRLVERMDALLAEQERLSRRSSALAAREQEIRHRLRELESAPPVAEGEADPEREKLLEQRLAKVAELERAALAGQAELARARAELEQRARELEERAAELERTAEELEARAAALEEAAAQAAEPEPPVEPPVATAEERPAQALASAAGRRNVRELERLVDLHEDAHPERADEWRFYLVYLDDYADYAGNLPPEFDSLVDDVFEPLLRG